MAKTGAERQAAYRARQSVQDSGQRRISTWIDTDAAMALEKLARRYGVTMRGALEMLLLREHEHLDKPLKNKKVSPDRKRNVKAALPRNDRSSTIGSEVDPIGALPGNDSAAPVVLDTASEVLLPSNGGPEVLPEIRAAMQPARGEQYSLDL